MLTARPAHIFASALALTCLAAAFLPHSEVLAAAGGIQTCTVGSPCTVGEFLYDDSSAPINSATCTITSWYPNDTPFYTAGTAMDGPTQSDGWYSKSFTTPATTGLYRTTISCTVSGDTLTIDKSFEAVAASSTDPSAIATAVWGFSGKSLDSFGTLPYDIWNYSTRTVSSFGDLIGNIWNSATRTLTGAGLGSGQLATQDDVVSVRNQVTNLSTGTGDLAEIKKTVDENRLLLEKVVNKPIIENVLEDTTPNVGEKLQNTRAVANQIYVNGQYLTSQSAVMASNWNRASGHDLLASVIELSNVLGEEGDTSTANTMFGQVNWVRDSWNWDEATSMYNQLVASRKMMNDLKVGLADYQKSPALYAEAKSLVKNFAALEKMVGSVSDTSTKKTLFAKIKTTNDLALSLDGKSQEVGKVLAEYSKSKDGALTTPKVYDLQNQVIALNRVPGITGALTKISAGDPNSIQNSLLGLNGIINSNIKLLALGSGKTLVNVWLEVGSIVFKTLATNPSLLISQDVEIKYYLPAEIKQEDIIKADAGLEVKYDAEKNQMYAEGKFTLAPGATRTFSIETKDIWEVTPEQIASLRTEVEDLFKPLEKTAYFAQGVSLKSDAISALDQIASLQALAVTPEDKIRSYREANILEESVDTKIAGLRELVTQASAAGSLFGFVGGSQTIAVWGLIIIIAAGFVFMTIYMRTITSKAKARVASKEKAGETKQVQKVVVHKGFHPLRFAAVIVAASVISAGTTGFVVNKMVTDNFEEKIKVLGTQVEKEVESTSAPALEQSTIPVEEEVMGTGVGGPYLVVVSDTPTGYLNVRKTPGGVEIARVLPGDKLPFLEEQAGWFKVSLEDGSEGWISSKYSLKE